MTAIITNERLVPLGEVARMLGIARTTLWRLRRTDPSFPAGIGLTDRILRYSPVEIRAWLEDRRRLSTSSVQLRATASGFATKKSRT